MDKNSISRFVNLTKDKVVKHSPEILLGVSIVSGVAAIAFAIKGTRDIEPVLAYADEELGKIKQCKEEKSEEEYSVSDYRKDLAIVYGVTAKNLAVIYAPSVFLEILSITTRYGSYRKLKKDLLVATAFGASIFAEFKDYRDRVIEKYGEEVDYELYNNIQEIETVSVDEKGKTKTKKEKVCLDPKPRSTSFFVGKDYCLNWEYSLSNSDNKDFLKLRISQAEQALNRELPKKLYVHMNRIMELCDVQPTEASRKLGIVYDPYWDPYEHLDKDGNPTSQISLRVSDPGIMDGDEAVLLVTVNGLEPIDIDSINREALYNSKNK